MALDGSKEASLPSCGDKPSLALQQRETHSKNSKVEEFCFVFFLYGVVRLIKKQSKFFNLTDSPHQTLQVNKFISPLLVVCFCVAFLHSVY